MSAYGQKLTLKVDQYRLVDDAEVTMKLTKILIGSVIALFPGTAVIADECPDLGNAFYEYCEVDGKSLDEVWTAKYNKHRPEYEGQCPRHCVLVFTVTVEQGGACATGSEPPPQTGWMAKVHHHGSCKKAEEGQ